ncbi:MAG TPA: hypothetical protein PKY38_15335 [Opitutaceae bacterium]|nr:hypothetical protein [Opitutaceae bacterium]
MFRVRRSYARGIFLLPPVFPQKKEEGFSRVYSTFHLLYLFSFISAFAGLGLLFFSFGLIPGVAYLLAVLVARWIVVAGSAHRAHENGFR